jgi:hypothetical protein
MPKRGAGNDVCSYDNFLGIYGLNSTNSIDNTRFRVMCLAVYCLLLGSPHIGWYSGIIVVLDVVRGERVFY